MRAETFAGRLVAALGRVDSEPEAPSAEGLSEQGVSSRIIRALMRSNRDPEDVIRFPANPPAAQELPTDPPPIDQPETDVQRKSIPTTLVVDDDESVARIIRRDLRRHGFQVVGIAYDGLQAIEMAKEKCPDAITMDIKMPKMDGIEATAAIVADNPRAKIVVVTAYSSPQSLYDSLAAGARGFLTKPFSDDELASTVEGVLRGELLVEASLAASLRRVEFGPLAFGADEKSVLQYLANGLDVQQMADAMSIPIEEIVEIQNRITKNINLRNLLAIH